MNRKEYSRYLLCISLACAIFLSLSGLGAAAYTDTGGGDHEGADWTISTDTTVNGVHTNIGTFTIEEGVTATLSSTAVFNVTATNIVVDGDIYGVGKGYGQHAGPSPGGIGGNSGCGGGGGGHGGNGGAGKTWYGPTGSGGVADISSIFMGSGGGYAYMTSNSGGPGGGVVLLNTNDLTINGTIDCSGATPSIHGQGGGGGGAGGSIVIETTNADVHGNLYVNGADGGISTSYGGGGGGGGGYLIINATTFDFSDASICYYGGAGGSGGAGNGYAGQIGYALLNSVSITDYIPGLIVIGSEEGTDYVTWSWPAVENADYYDVNLSGTWYYDYPELFINETDIVLHGSSSIEVIAYNTTKGLESKSVASLTLYDNPVVLTNLSDVAFYETELVEIDANYTDVDGDTVTFTCDRMDLFSDFSSVDGTGTWQTDDTNAGTYAVTIYGDDGYGSNVSQTITITIIDNCPVAPVLSNSTGDFYVDWIWNDDAMVDYYNVSLNDVWTNGTTVVEMNDTDVGSHGTSTIQIIAFNETFNTQSEIASDSVTLNSPVVLSGLSDIIAYESDLISIDADFTDNDGDTITFTCDRNDLFSDFSTVDGTGTWQTDSTSAGEYVVTIYADDAHGSNVSQSITITVNEYTLITPVLNYVSDNFFVDWSWDVENADSYNVSLNGVWTNGTAILEINDTPMNPHETSEIQVIAYNESSDVFSEIATDSVTLSNNPVVLSGLSDISIYETELVSIDVDSTDADGDTVTFTCSRMDLFTDFNTTDGTGSWQTDSASSGSYDVTLYGDDGYGSNVSQTITITVSEYSLSTPVLSSSTGNFFVDWTWVSIENADSYNISLNDVWTNGTAVLEMNDSSMEPHATSVIQVFAYNETSDSLSEMATSSVTLANNPVLISGLSDISVYEGDIVEVNVDATDADGDNIIFYSNRSDLFSNLNETTGEGSWQTDSASAGTYDVIFYADDEHGFVASETITITVNEYALSTPVLSSSSDNFYVDWSWSAVDNADSYNVSLNGVWTNGTAILEINDTPMNSHATSVIQVLAYNVTSDSLSEIASDSVTLTNNPVILTDLNDINVYESSLVEIDANFTDVDDDEITFTCDRMDLFSDFNALTGIGSWQTDSASTGTYEVTITADDSNGSNVSQTITITVNEYVIGGDENLSYVSGNFFVNWTWNAVENADYYNVSENDVWVYNGTNTFYESTEIDPHGWSNITIYGYNVASDVLTELVSNETQLQNNPIAISNLNDLSVVYGNTVTIDADVIDLDDDVGTFACNRTDLFEDFNVTDGTGTWVTNSTMVGTYSVTFNVTDGYGSISNKTISIVIRAPTVTTSSSSGGSSGGGGGGGTTSESYENIASVAVSTSTVSTGSSVKYEYDSSEDVVSSITFDALQNLGNVKARVEVLYDQSEFAGEGITDKEVYHYFNVWMSRSGLSEGEQFENAEITFAVEKAWLEENGFSAESLQLNYYSEEEKNKGWNGLATEITGSDDEYYYLSAKVQQFSCFAVTGGEEESATEGTIAGSTSSGSSSHQANAGSSYQVESDIVDEEGSTSVEGGFFSNMFSSVKEFFAHLFGNDPIEEAYDDGKFDSLIEDN